MVTIAYDEKPDIQALALTTPDRPPVHGQHPSHLRDYEYKQLGTVSLWAGLDLHTETIIETVSDSYKSADFLAFLKKLDGSPGHQKIRLVCGTTIPCISRKRRGAIGHQAAAIRLRVHADPRFVAASHRESIQQDDWFHVARNPRS